MKRKKKKKLKIFLGGTTGLEPSIFTFKIIAIKVQKLNRKFNRIKPRFHYERGKKHSLFVLLLFFALASILTARFNRRSIKERNNALFHARSGNGPLVKKIKNKNYLF